MTGAVQRRGAEQDNARGGRGNKRRGEDGGGLDDRKWARVRCVLKVRHQRSEDAPGGPSAPPTEDEALKAR